MLARLCQEFITMSECQAEQDMGTFLLLLQHVALDCVTGMKRPLEFSMSILHRFVGYAHGEHHLARVNVEDLHIMKGGQHFLNTRSFSQPKNGVMEIKI